MNPKYTADEHDRAKSEMLGEFNKAIADAADLRSAAAPADGPSIEPGAARTSPGVPTLPFVQETMAHEVVLEAAEEFPMAIDVQQLAMQIYIQTVSPGIMDRVIQGSSLEKLFKAAAENSIAAAEAFAHVFEKTTPARRSG